MSLPRTREGLEAEGYKYSTRGKCKACQADIEWWVTPKKAWMPFNKDLEVHWVTCPYRDRFKGKNTK